MLRRVRNNRVLWRGVFRGSRLGPRLGRHRILGVRIGVVRFRIVSVSRGSGKGDGVSAAALIPPPRDHTDATIMNAISDANIAQTVRYGGAARGYPNMPSFPTVAHEELVALVAYVRSLSSPEVTTVEVGDVN